MFKRSVKQIDIVLKILYLNRNTFMYKTFRANLDQLKDRETDVSFYLENGHDSLHKNSQFTSLDDEFSGKL